MGRLGVEGFNKMEKGFMDMDNSVVIVGGVRELNGNGKKYNNFFFK